MIIYLELWFQLNMSKVNMELITAQDRKKKGSFWFDFERNEE